MSFNTVYKDHQVILYDNSVFTDPDTIIFDAKVLAQRDWLTGSASGRGTSHFFQHNNMDMVLRHYHRGGMIAKFLKDHYFWMGLKSSRPWKEWYLLQDMWQSGLPVPRPLACRILLCWPFYRADLLMTRIMASESLSQRLISSHMDGLLWRKLGQTVRSFHQYGIDHVDLNAHNILLDENNNIYLIDFDKGKKCSPDSRWQAKNTQRLRRSLDKLAMEAPLFHFREQDWLDFMAAYQ